ncbi:hypothetical protein RZO55_20985 [Clostridium boliviensis]|uniref:Uncharacterized protein n=1 Tax=Clostridium boliviensis TaxID=318465 RepID=A0ABU4GSY7_9CLOT|nr:hypothetical protein [Clostridium boliviensis]MDW2800053.1 hypothetical protein [Clostridium boliviensis]
MRKKIINSIIVLFVLLFIGGGLFFLVPRVREETTGSRNIKYTLEQLYNQSGHFYVYFNREDCPYCDNVKKDIEKFAKDEKVIMVDTELLKGIKNYDWDAHEVKYDVEIGEKTDGRAIKFYDGKTEKDIKQLYPSLNYKILWVNQRYAELHEGKKYGKVYAVYTHPVLEKEDLKKENLIIPAVPILMEFRDHVVINYFFDDKEIIAFLKLNTKPLDSYWNLD